MSEIRSAPGGYSVHESSYVDEGAKIGAGTRIWHFCHVMSGATIGEQCSLGQNVVVMARTRLGRNVKVQNNVSIYEGVECEDDVFLGPSMVFTNVRTPRSHISRKHEYQRTIVRRGTSIGANATILCGLTLGQYSFVAAGAVVTQNVQDFALVAGVPARTIGWVCRCGVRLDLGATLAEGERATCASCGEGYVSRGGTLTANHASADQGALSRGGTSAHG